VRTTSRTLMLWHRWGAEEAALPWCDPHADVAAIVALVDLRQVVA